MNRGHRPRPDTEPGAARSGARALHSQAAARHGGVLARPPASSLAGAPAGAAGASYVTRGGSGR